MSAVTDLHTHILCGMDDGAKTPEESLQMLRQEQSQGVTRVVLTPHFYRDRERTETFLARRETAMERLLDFLETLPAEERQSLPELRLGAEVAWRPNMVHWENAGELCIGGTKNMLLELPFVPWHRSLCDEIYSFMGQTGISPVLAHMERYLPIQDKGQIREVLSLGLPVQMGTEAFLRFATRGGGLRGLKRWAHVLASDCHNTESRPPNLGDAMAVVRKRLGADRAEEICRFARSLTEE